MYLIQETIAQYIIIYSVFGSKIQATDRCRNTVPLFQGTPYTYVFPFRVLSSILSIKIRNSMEQSEIVYHHIAGIGGIW